MNKKLRKSSRGLTFSLDDNELIGIFISNFGLFA